MIFVTLGTNDKRFDRLLKAVEKAIKDGQINEEVIAQVGFTSYESDLMQVVEYCNQSEFEDYLNRASLVICHGGVGSIMSALQKDKIILAAARLQEHGEHVNNHQLELLTAFEDDGYLIYMKDLEDISPYLKQAKSFAPKKFVSNQDNFAQMIKDWINNN